MTFDEFEPRVRLTGYDTIVPLLPEEGLIRKFITLTEGGEICPRFRFFVFVGTLGAVINRKVFIQRGSKETFPTLYANPWIFLIAPQGLGHKSSAVRIGRNVLEAMPSNKKPKLLAAKITPEALVRSLSSPAVSVKDGVAEEHLKLLRNKAIGTIISSELGSLMGKERYMTGMAMLLTDIYDCQDVWDSETISRAGEKMYEVCLSILGASTPDWMQTLLPKDAFEIGFMSRMVLVPLPTFWQVKKIPQSVPKGLFKEICKEVEEIAEIEGEMVLREETWERYKEWYLNMPELPPGPQREYLTRKQDHVLRLAMILQLVETRELKLELKYFNKALGIFDSIEGDVLDLISYISMDPRMRIVKRILTTIEYNGSKGILEHELLSDVYFLLSRAQEFDEVIHLLLRTKKIKIEHTTGGVVYKRRNDEN